MNENLKKYLLIYLVAFVAGVLDFATATFFQNVLHVPLFFDTIFLMAVLFLYGPLPALFSYVVNVYCGCLKLVIL